MSHLWFDSLSDPESGWGGLHFAKQPDGLWGLLRMDLVYPNDLDLESEQVLGHLGGVVNAIGIALLEERVPLPEELHQWVEMPDRPASELGGWVAELCRVDEAVLIGLGRAFGDWRIVVTVVEGGYVAVAVPKSAGLVRLKS